MKHKLLLPLLAIFLIPLRQSAQLSGVYSVPSTYSTIGAAISALNSVGVTGAVTININAGFTESVPSPSGYTLFPVAGSSSVNTVTFRKNGSGANPVLIAGTGTATPASAVQDGVWLFAGADNIIVDGINILDPNSSNPATMEFGFGFFRLNAGDGCQNNIIRNCQVTLSNANNALGFGVSADGSRGISFSSSAPATQTTAVTVTASAGSNSYNKIYGNTIQNCNIGIALIGFAASSPYTNADQGNDIGGTVAATGNTIVNFGGGGSLSAAVGVRTLAQYSLNVSNNLINNNNGGNTNHAQLLRGIYLNTAFAASSSVNNNTITVKSGSTNQNLVPIENLSGSASSTSAVTFTGNLITGCTYTGATSGAFLGIFNNGASAGSVTIQQNTLTGISTNASSGTNYVIVSSGAVPSAINISQNVINGFTFTASGAGLYAISNTNGVSTADLTISSNTIQSIVSNVLSTGSYFLINNNAATIQQSIDANQFVNLNMNTSGSVTFISDNISQPAGGIQSISSNSIVTAFSKSAGNTVTLLNSNGVSPSTASQFHSNNNFSNINLTGATTMAGWANLDGGSPVKTFTGNLFQNWSCGSGSVTAVNFDYSGNSTINSNTISGISATGGITGIVFGPSNVGSSSTINANLISALTSTGTGNAVTGINIGATAVALTVANNTVNALSTTAGVTINGVNTAATSATIASNRIFNIEASNNPGTTNGLRLAGSGNTTCYNNMIADLRAPLSTGSNVVNGISVSSGSISNFFYNSVYLSGSPSSSLSGSSALAAFASTVCLKNNILINKMIPAGGAFAVALRRTTTTLGTYSITSNNNLFYAGTPSSVNLLYEDGTNQLQTISALQATVSPREAASATENTSFLSVSGLSPSFLHVNPNLYTLAESGGSNVGGISVDIDGDIRQGNTGYTGFGSAPDIGADEFAGANSPCSTVSSGSVVSSTSLACAGQSVSFQRNSGTGGPDVSYQWKVASNIAGPYSNVSGGTGGTTLNYTTAAMTAGSYYFIMVATCSVTSSSASTTPLAVTVNSIPVIAVSSGTVCSGLSFTLVPSGATSYTFSSGSAVVTVSANASYSVTGSTGPCVSSNTAVATVSVSPSPTVALAGGAICPGQSFTLVAGGASSYAINGGTVVVSPLVNTSYTATGTSSAGCAAVNTATATVTVQVSPTVSATNGTICPGGSFVINPAGAVTYSYSSGSATVSPASTTNYSVTGYSSAGCPSSNTATLSVFVAPNPTVVVPNGTVCTGKSYTIVPSGAATYTFSSGAVVTPTANTSYSVSGTSSLGCLSGNTAVLTVSLVPLPSITIPNGTLCTGQAYTLNPSGAVSYTFSGGSAVVSPTHITSYSVVGTASTGCTSTNLAVATLTAYVSPTITISGPFFTCSHKQLTFTATGANTYTWSNGSIGTGVVTPSATMVYSVTGEDIIGCKGIATRTIQVTPTPTLQLSNDTAVCIGSSVTFTAGGATSYTWSTGNTSPSFSVMPSVTQVFTVSGTTSGCTGTAAVSVSVEPAPVLTASSDKQVLCSGQQVVFTVGGASNYTWSGGAVTGSAFTPSLSSYTVTAAGANGCIGAATISLTINSLPPIVATSNKNPLCIGELATLFVDGPDTYTWSTGQTTPTITVSPVVMTTYTVSGYSTQGCFNATTLTINVTDCTAITENSNDTWTAYPNPFHDSFVIAHTAGEHAMVRVYAADGRLVHQGVIGTEVHTVDLREFASGFYQVVVVSSGNVVMKSKIAKD